MRELPHIPACDQLVARYGLQPHPEGGFYRRIWCSSGRIAAQALPPCYTGERPWSTSILFLLRAGEHSRLHRLHSDEIWHFLLGGPLRLAVIHPDGSGEDHLLGQDLAAGQELVHVVPGGGWFGAMPGPETSYALVGCTVAPGFDFADFELAPDAGHIRNSLPHCDAAASRILDDFFPRAPISPPKPLPLSPAVSLASGTDARTHASPACRENERRPGQQPDKPALPASLEHFPFETLGVSNHTVWRFAEKTRFFRLVWAGRRYDAASRFTFFTGKML